MLESNFPMREIMAQSLDGLQHQRGNTIVYIDLSGLSAGGFMMIALAVLVVVVVAIFAILAKRKCGKRSR